MDDLNQAYGWRKGYPSEEMIAAHPSRLWLVKGKRWSVKRLFSLFERIERNQLDLIEEQCYFVSENGEITLLENRKFGEGIERETYIAFFYEDEHVKIYRKGDDKFQYSKTDFISHAETVLKLLQEQGKLKQTENQRRYAEDYFCPIDEDGNKVPWPNSVAPRGFISWVDWDASKH